MRLPSTVAFYLQLWQLELQYNLLPYFVLFYRLLSVDDGASSVSHISASHADYLVFIVPSRNRTVFYKWNGKGKVPVIIVRDR